MFAYIEVISLNRDICWMHISDAEKALSSRRENFWTSNGALAE